MDTCAPHVSGAAASFYADALSLLDGDGIPYLVGGAYAFASYSRISRETKDFDIFLVPDDLPRALAVFERSGCRTELPFPHWLGKVHSGDHFMDLIFSSGNGVARVDESWFEHAVDADVLGRPMRLCPPEEMIWSKAYVQERERYDGADVMHLIRALGPTLDWGRLIVRFGDHWRLLLSTVVLFGFVYPDQRQQIPSWVQSELLLRLDDAAEAAERRDPRVRRGETPGFVLLGGFRQMPRDLVPQLVVAATGPQRRQQTPCSEAEPRHRRSSEIVKNRFTMPVARCHCASSASSCFRPARVIE